MKKCQTTIDKRLYKLYTNKAVGIQLKQIKYRGVEQLAARRAHNPKVDSSSLSPATTIKSRDP